MIAAYSITDVIAGYYPPGSERACTGMVATPSQWQLPGPVAHNEAPQPDPSLKPLTRRPARLRGSEVRSSQVRFVAPPEFGAIGPSFTQDSDHATGAGVLRDGVRPPLCAPETQSWLMCMRPRKLRVHRQHRESSWLPVVGILSARSPPEKRRLWAAE